MTPLFGTASLNTSTEIVKFLLDHGAEINAVAEVIRKATPLHCAVDTKNNLEFVKLLL